MRLLFLLTPFVLLTISYVYFIAPFYSYFSIDYINTDPLVLVLVFVAAVQLCLVRADNPGILFVTLFYILKLVPLVILTSVAAYGNTPVFFNALLAFEILFLGCFSKFTIPTASYFGDIAVTISVVFIVATAIILLTTVGFSSLNLNLLNVYEFRAARAGLDLGSIFTYIERWSNTIFLPYLMLLSIARKRWSVVAVLILVSVLLFGLSNHKSYIAALLGAVAVYVVLGWNRPVRWVVSFMCIGLAGVLAADWALDSFYANAFTTRRIFFVPARLDVAYFSIFSDIGHVRWSNSILSPFLPYPFDLGYPFLVGQELFGKATTSANTGFLATGFMHAGTLGVVLYSVILSFLLMCLNGFPTSMRRVGVAIAAYPIVSIFLNSDLPTGMLTGGLGVAFILGILSAGEETRSAKRNAATLTPSDTAVA